MTLSARPPSGPRRADPSPGSDLGSARRTYGVPAWILIATLAALYGRKRTRSKFTVLELVEPGDDQVMTLNPADVMEVESEPVPGVERFRRRRAGAAQGLPWRREHDLVCGVVRPATP